MSKIVSLTVNCPHCGKSLMDETYLINNKPGIRLTVQTSIRQRGSIWLSSIYGDYNFSCEFLIPEGDVVEFFCPHCSENLRRKKIECDACGAPVVSFNVDIGGRVTICTRSGCKNHYVVFEDLDATIRKFYDEYGYH
jgi:predicted RNA-binding Zn-ribbon protein involved in translation (DUF1610 family)